jgi:hypothetical protein
LGFLLPDIRRIIKPNNGYNLYFIRKPAQIRKFLTHFW